MGFSNISTLTLSLLRKLSHFGNDLGHNVKYKNNLPRRTKKHAKRLYNFHPPLSKKFNNIIKPLTIPIGECFTKFTFIKEYSFKTAQQNL
jgi:hypothetical protein